MQYFAPQNCSEVFADQARLSQVVVNLLSNAIKFSPAAGCVTVRVFETDAGVEVDVEDQGRGVPPELRAAVFDKFTQVEPGDERLKGGSGLGLAICKAIVEQHGGQIGVRDRAPQSKANSGRGDVPEHVGSCFWFQVPKASDAGRVAQEIGSTVS